MKRFLLTCLTAFALAAALPALASPVAYVNAPMSTPQELVNTAISNINSSISSAAPLVTGSGTTAITASGLRTQISITGLTTAAGVTSATTTVTNTSVAASSLIFCQANGYGGTGNPTPVNIVPGVGSFTLAVQNTHASAALNATVPISCMVYN